MPQVEAEEQAEIEVLAQSIRAKITKAEKYRAELTKLNELSRREENEEDYDGPEVDYDRLETLYKKLTNMDKSAACDMARTFVVAGADFEQWLQENSFTEKQALDFLKIAGAVPMARERIRPSMQELAQEIRENDKAASDATLAAAKAAAEAKRRYMAGETDGCNSWPQWVEKFVGLSVRRANELVKIGRAADPAQALSGQRAAAKERMAARRQAERSAQPDNVVPIRPAEAKPPERREGEIRLEQLTDLVEQLFVADPALFNEFKQWFETYCEANQVLSEAVH